MTTILVATTLVLTAPAMAQEPGTDSGETSAASQQYTAQPSVAPSVADGVRDVSDTVGRGAEAVNDSLADGRVAGLTMLPNTGGAPPLWLGVGVLLIGAGLLIRRIVG